MEFEADSPQHSMELDQDVFPGSGSSIGSEAGIIGPNAAALQAVAVAPARRRSRSLESPVLSSCSQQQHSSGSEEGEESNSTDEEDEDEDEDDDYGWVPVPEAEVAAVMQRYHELQQEFVEQQLALGPFIIPDNQAMLEARVAELLQQRCGRRLASADPAAAAAASGSAAGAAASPPPPPPAAAAAAAAGAEAAAEAVDSGSDGEEEAAFAGTSAAGAAAAAGGGSSRQRSLTVKFSSNEGKGYSLQAFRLSYEQRLPEYFSWSHLVRNELATGNWQRMFYTDDTGETVPASDDEDGEQKPWNGPEGLSHDYALRQLAQEYTGRLHYLLSALETGLEQDHEMVTADELAGRLAFLAEQDTPKLPPTEQDRRQRSFRDSVKALHRHFCRRCNIYNCRLHGGGHVQPAQLPPPPPPPDKHAPPCSSSCWRLQQQQQPGADAVLQQAQTHQQQQQQQGQASQQQQQQQQAEPEPEPVPDLSEYERGLLQQGLQMFGRDPCKLSLLLLDRSCAQVAAYLTAVPLQAEAPEGADAAAGRRKNHPRKGSSNNPAHKRVSGKRYNMNPDDLPPYTPCTCVGLCQPGTCSCIKSSNWCEKFCACVSCKTRDCIFQGCKCTTQCRMNSCSCISAGRECDPDVCRNCSSTALGTAAPDKACCNMGLRLRKHARIYMGLSSVSGWGAFLGQAARQHDFLGEYVGELLSQAEADRRGKAYDRSNNSYLFGVNSAWVLDAREAGNNLRFANHRSQPNCQTRVLMVDGDHRVGLFAMKDIAAGEELFYNYRYDLDNAPDWAICS